MTTGQPAIELEHLRVVRGGHAVLGDVSLRVAEGSVIGLCYSLVGGFDGFATSTPNRRYAETE